MFKVAVQGRSAHASNPEQGHNAITDAARLVFGLDLLTADLPLDPFLGPGTMVVTHIESHAPGLNAVPDSCTFYVDRRLTLGETPTRAQIQIESVIQREGIEARVGILNYQAASYTGEILKVQEAFPAWALDKEHPLIDQLRQVVETVCSHSPTIGHWPFSTDGVHTKGDLGIPTVGFGPGNPLLAHTAEEHMHLKDVVEAAHVYALFAARLLG
jgi:putative selenium metabolism hydrolase